MRLRVGGTREACRAVGFATLALAACGGAFAQGAPGLPVHCEDLAGVLLPPAAIALPTDGALGLPGSSWT